jgi:hypothetical protein
VAPYFQSTTTTTIIIITTTFNSEWSWEGRNMIGNVVSEVL